MLLKITYMVINNITVIFVKIFTQIIKIDANITLSDKRSDEICIYLT